MRSKIIRSQRWSALVPACLLCIGLIFIIVYTNASPELQASRERAAPVPAENRSVRYDFAQYLLLHQSVHSLQQQQIQEQEQQRLLQQERYHYYPTENMDTTHTVHPYLDVNTFQYQRLLRQRGYESTALHDFKSPYIVDPAIYSSDVTVLKPPGRRPMRIISCYKCADWFIDDYLNAYRRDIKTCPYSQCYFDAKGEQLSKADVVLFSPGVETMPSSRPLGQIWAFANWESPLHTNFPTPYSQWKGVFNWTVGYRLNADIFIPYNRLAWRARDTLLSHGEYQKIALAKTKTVAWFVSNCHTPSGRLAYVREMQNHVDIDIYGRCGSKECEKSEGPQLLNSTYKFYLSFENSICQDYASEKLFKIFDGRLHVIPVVRAGFDCNTYLPPNTFINARDFKTPKDLAQYLGYLSRHVALYSAMLREKDKFTTVGYINDWCETCQKLHVGRQPKVIEDIDKYTSAKVCWRD